LALTLISLARQRCVPAAFILLAVSTAQTATPPTEYAVKAAYLYNFLKFVEWPRDGSVPSSGPFCIAILGSDPFGVVLDKTVAGKEVRGRSVTVRRVEEPKAATGCHVVFVGRQRNLTTARALRSLEKTGALTVGDEPGFAQHGGVVDFVLDEDSVGFEINPSAAAREGLTLSPRLLQLAKIVSERTP
jgi:hypothetical protein